MGEVFLDSPKLIPPSTIPLLPLDASEPSDPSGAEKPLRRLAVLPVASPLVSATPQSIDALRDEAERVPPRWSSDCIDGATSFVGVTSAELKLRSSMFRKDASSAAESK